MTITLDLQIATKVKEGLPTEADFSLWLSGVLNQFQPDAEVTVRIVNEDEIQALNQQYRDKKGTTNIISFPFEAPENIEIDLLGDLVICRHVVESEAKEQNKPVLTHWAHMIVHGTLHLLGYDHIQDDDADEMESLEIEIMQSMGYPNPYIAK